MLVLIFISLFKIRRIVKNNTVEQLDKIHFVTTDEPGTPFSFFRWLFWNKKIELQSEKGEQIFRHELFHIEQKHSWDTIYMEFLTVIFWINWQRVLLKLPMARSPPIRTITKTTYIVRTAEGL